MKGQSSHWKYKELKGKLAGILACVVFLTSIPQVPVYGFTNGKGMEHYYINDENLDVEVTHTAKKGNTEADIFIKATLSDALREDGGAIEKVELRDGEGNYIKSAKKTTDENGDKIYQTSVDGNGFYTVWVSYNSDQEESDSGKPEEETSEVIKDEATESKEEVTSGAEDTESEEDTELEEDTESEEETSPEEDIPSSEDASEDVEASGDEEISADADTAESDLTPIESVGLGVIDFLFPVIEARAAEENQVSITPYEINDLYKKGNQADISFDVSVTKSSQGSEVIITATPSDAGIQKGVAAIQDILLLSDKDDSFDVEELRSFEYQESEREEDHATFFLEEDGKYYIGISYEAEEDAEGNVYSILIPCNIGSTDGVYYFGVDNTEIVAGENFDLLKGVKAEDEAGVEVPVGILTDGGFDPQVPGVYVVTYAPQASLKARNAIMEHTRERTIVVKETSASTLLISSNIHGTGSGKTLAIIPGEKKEGILSVTFKLPENKTNRYLKFDFPNFITVKAWPEDNYEPVKTEAGKYSTLYQLDIKDSFIGQTVSFDLYYDTNYQVNFDDYFDMAELSDIKVTGGYDGVAVETQGVGDFTLDYLTGHPITESHLMLEKDKVVSKRSASHQLKRDTTGKFIFPIVPVDGGKTDDKFIFNVDNQLIGRPYRIEALRVFAPEGFKFQAAVGYGSKLKIGKNETGFWYADILDVSSQGIALEGLLLELEKDELTAASYTSPDSIVRYSFISDAGEKAEGSYVTTPLLTVAVDSGKEFIEKDMLHIYGENKLGYYTPGLPVAYRIYCNETVFGYLTRIGNMSKYIRDLPNGNKLYDKPNYNGEGLSVKLIVPGSNQINVRKLVLYPTLSSALSEPGSIKIREMKLENTDGTTKILSLSDLGISSDVILDRFTDKLVINMPASLDLSKTKSVEIIFDKLMEANLSIYWHVSVNQEIESTISKTGTELINKPTMLFTKPGGTIPGSPAVFDGLTVYPKRIWNWGFGGANGQLGSYGGPKYDCYVGYMDTDRKSMGKGVTIENIKVSYKFTDSDDRSKLAGDLRILIPCNVKITKISNLGNETVDSVSGKTYVGTLNPWSSKDEYIKELILEFDSLTKTADGETSVVRFVANNPTRRAEYYPYLDEGSDAIKMKIEMSSESSQWPLTTQDRSIAISRLGLMGGVTISDKPDKITADPGYTKYQGNTFDYELPDYKFKFKMDYVSQYSRLFKWMYPDTYIFLNDESNFSFQGVEAPWKYERLSTDQGNLLRVYRDDEPTAEYGNVEFERELPRPKLKFKVLNSYAGGTLHPVKEVWYDMSQVEELKKAWLYENDQKISVPEDRFESGTPITSNKVLKYSDISQFRGVDVPKNTKTEVSLTAGVNGLFESSASGVSSDQYEAKVFVNTGSFSYTDYSIDLDIPQKDVSGSEYGMYLSAPVTITSHSGTKLQATYKQKGKTEFVEGDKIAKDGWREVTQIKITPESGTSIDGNTEQTITLPLTLDKKMWVGDQKALFTGRYYANGVKADLSAAEFVLKDYQRNITAWLDENEDGKYQSNTEPTVPKQLKWKLSANGKVLRKGLEYNIEDGTNSYMIEVADVEDLKLTVEQASIPSNYKLIPLMLPFSGERTDSDFDRETKQVSLDSTKARQDFSLGFVRIGELTVEDVNVKQGLSRSVNPVISGLPSAAPQGEYTYRYDVKAPEYATITSNGMVTGMKLGFSDVTLAVINKFGDEIQADFKINVRTNTPPTVNPNVWKIVEGDVIGDLWTNVTYGDIEDFNPDGIVKNPMLRAVAYKEATVWKDDSKSTPISLGDVSNAPGSYPVTYTVRDDDGNEVSEDSRIIVYGKLMAQITPYDPGHFYVSTTEQTFPGVFFYYKDESGNEQSTKMIPKGVLGTAGLNQFVITKEHPLSKDVTSTAIKGDGHTSTYTVKAFADSTVTFTNRPAEETYIVLPPNTEVDLMEHVSAAYQHYTELIPTAGDVQLTVWELKNTGGVNTEEKIEGGKVTIQQPGIYQYKYKATANESYVTAGETNPEGNQAEATRRILAIRKPEITTASASDVVYVTPDQAKDPNFIKRKINAKASYTDENGTTQKLETTFAYSIIAGKPIDKVKLATAIWFGGKEVRTEKDVKVIIRDLPDIQANPISFRAGQYSSLTDEFLRRDITLTPNDNTGFAVELDQTIELGTAGHYTYKVTATDLLTNGSTEARRDIYIQGNPIITVRDKDADIDEIVIQTHKSTEAELIKQMKQYVDSEVTYVGPTIGSESHSLKDKVEYTVSGDYVPGTAGTYTITLKVDDSSVISQQTDFTDLVAVPITKNINVRVADQIYHVNFSSSDEVKGAFEEGTDFTADVVHGRNLTNLPIPLSKEGYHFDGFKVSEDVISTTDVTLKDGTVIPSGAVIPKDTVIPGEQAKDIIINKEVSFEAVFNASPVILGNNVQLYQGEAYNRSQLNISVTDLDGTDGVNTEIDDGHVDINTPGTYQIKVTSTDEDGNTAVIYRYIQIFGHVTLSGNLDQALNLREGDEVKAADILDGVTAAYQAPPAIPGTPWEDGDKKNNHTTPVEIPLTPDMIETELPTQSVTGRLNVTVSIPGALGGNPGGDSWTKKVNVHGNPVVTAANNTLYTHLATGQDALIAAIKTGIGSGVKQPPLKAYTTVVLDNGSTEIVNLPEENIRYEVVDFVANTEGMYTVRVTVHDTNLSQLGGIPAKTAETTQVIAVGDRTYTVSFESGENGSFDGNKKVDVPVIHGKPVRLPSVTPDEGYEFAGWVDAAGNSITDIGSTPVTSDQTVTAVFEKKEFTVRFIGKKDRVIKTELVKYKESATAPTSKEMGAADSRNFTGWSTEFSSITGNLDVYATYRTSSGGGDSGSGGGDTPGGNPPGESKPDNGNAAPGETLPGETQPGETQPGETQPGETQPGETLPGNGANIPDGNTPGGGNSSGNDNTGNKDLINMGDGNVPLGKRDAPPAPAGYVEDSTRMNDLPQNTEEVPLTREKQKKDSGKEVVVKKTGEQNGNAEEGKASQSEINDGTVPASGIPKRLLEAAKKCTFHFLLLAIALLEGIYLLLKKKKEKDESEE